MSRSTLTTTTTIGVLGSGQLGRMLALAARPMGIHTHVFSPVTDSPTEQVADRAWIAPYDDLDAVRQFAESCDAVTYEFENVPLNTALAVEAVTPLRPGVEALRISQNRLREKNFMKEIALPTTAFLPITSEAELEAAAEFERPAVLKTAESGYDGKGQLRIDKTNLKPAWVSLNKVDCVLEAWVSLEKEISVVVGRDVDGNLATYGPIENHHTHHILDYSTCPAELSPTLEREAKTAAIEIAKKLDIVGVICVEFFITHDGRLLVNEIAPRPHNSGHLTIEAHTTSQFEQQLRAVCGFPLGEVTQLAPAAMGNLLGDLWPTSETDPNWGLLCADPALKLHLYGKASARPGRKMGHVTALGENALARILAGRNRLLGET